MVAIQEWIADFSEAVKRAFGDRAVFIGLQGSYGRGEASESSDLDVVVILDRLDMADLRKYENAIEALPHREKICGFVSGRQEILHWERSDSFQLYYDTEPVFGSLDFLLPFPEEEVKRAVRIGACNLYHACCHNILHEKSVEILRTCYKASVFALQAKCFLRSGTYCRKKEELSLKLPEADRQILEFSLEAKAAQAMEENQFARLSEALLLWSGNTIAEFGE